MSVRLSNVVFSKKETKYHGICRVKYQTAEKVKIKHKKRTSQVNGTESDAGYRHFTRGSRESMQSSEIKKKEVLLLIDLNRHYQHLATGFGGDEFIDVTSNLKKIEEKIRKHNGDDTLISSGKSRKGNIVYSASMSLEEAVRKTDVTDNDFKEVPEMALMFRKEIFNAKLTLLPKDVKFLDIEKGDVEIPEPISVFFQNLIAGPDSRRWKESRKAIRTQSLCENVIFSATSGQAKSRKHLMLGMTIKSFTGSRKAIQILNKLDHCVSYHAVEDIETEMTLFKLIKKK